MKSVLIQSSRRLLERVNAWEPELRGESDADLRRRARAMRYRAQTHEPLATMLPEAFALVREASSRTTGMRHFDVQMLGGIAMARRSLAEMQTGEGKTLTATLPLVLHALAGKGAHLATVNDYLARRDAELTAPIYNLLGLKVGVIESKMPSDLRRQAYDCDITYGTAKEFGFDYLRDRLLLRHLAEQGSGDLGVLLGHKKDRSDEKPVGRGLHFALVDEADSILIDEAGTPLIISAMPSDEQLALERYRYAARAIESFKEGVHYTLRPRELRVELTADGRHCARALRLPKALDAVGTVTLYADLERALRVRQYYHRDRQYVIVDGEVSIVDEFTGRVAEGRKWRDGIHQAVEAKEGIEITGESGQAARITVQDFFLRYRHLAGMSGTAVTASRELKRIYRLRVRAIPTNRPPIRVRLPDAIFGTSDAKLAAIVDEIRAMHAVGRPVLVGTRSIDKSEALSRRLKQAGIAHQVLNAHEIAREAEIVSGAGARGRVTVSTNMAGRGTDIKLGPGVAELGGLHVICTEMHDAARIDRQLIGRCGRQGDPGSYRQYLALDDDILERGLPMAQSERLRELGKSKGASSRMRRHFLRAQQSTERNSFRQRQGLLWQERASSKSRKEMGLDPHLDAVE
jgi:preprotein translocase subunit SecA